MGSSIFDLGLSTEGAECFQPKQSIAHPDPTVREPCWPSDHEVGDPASAATLSVQRAGGHGPRLMAGTRGSVSRGAARNCQVCGMPASVDLGCVPRKQ